jgi:hypothetical protein
VDRSSLPGAGNRRAATHCWSSPGTTEGTPAQTAAKSAPVSQGGPLSDTCAGRSIGLSEAGVCAPVTGQAEGPQARLPPVRDRRPFQGHRATKPRETGRSSRRPAPTGDASARLASSRPSVACARRCPDLPAQAEASSEDHPVEDALSGPLWTTRLTVELLATWSPVPEAEPDTATFEVAGAARRRRPAGCVCRRAGNRRGAPRALLGPWSRPSCRSDTSRWCSAHACCTVQP